MVVIRCTRKVLARLPYSCAQAPPDSTTVLGDWYANFLFTRKNRLILLVNERTLLSVLLPARELKTIASSLQSSLQQLLLTLGVAPGAIASELQEMQQVEYARTASRVVLGSMNDLAFMTRVRLEDDPNPSLHSLALELSKVPCSPIGMNYPGDVALSLLSGVHRSGHVH